MVASALGINPYFVGDYQQAARNFPVGKVISIISCLREYDLKSKGVENGSATDGELMKELIFKILH
jgi:DNA polymerase-3 subunit delta